MPINPEEQPPSLAPRITPYRPDPNEGCRYPAPCFFESRVLVFVAGTFDVTDELMRLFGQDPYRYEKARFMKATEAMRVGFAARAQADDLRKASAQLRPRLEEIAGDEQRTEAERRAIIEALANEMDVTTAEGRQARATIDEFLRTRFGSRQVTPVGGRLRSRRSRRLRCLSGADEIPSTCGQARSARPFALGGNGR